MERTKIDDLIIYLLAISNYAKDIHYNCSGVNFYGQHLFADRIQDSLDDYIDKLKEICLLGHGFKVSPSSEYLEKASKIIPSYADFKNMKQLLVMTLGYIETIDNISKGDENLIGAISEDLQNNLGLINIMLGEFK